MFEAITNFDMGLLHWIQNTITGDVMNNIMVFFTKLGDAGVFWIALGVVLLIIPKTRRVGLVLLVSLAVAALVGNIIIKPIVGRIRPCDIETGFKLLIPNPGKTSFPSGHAISSFASATAIFLFNKKWGSGALVIAGIIGFSRCYLFVHYPTDILVGAILGIITAIAVKWIFDRYAQSFLQYRKKEEEEHESVA